MYVAPETMSIDKHLTFIKHFNANIDTRSAFREIRVEIAHKIAEADQLKIELRVAA